MLDFPTIVLPTPKLGKMSLRFPQYCFSGFGYVRYVNRLFCVKENARLDVICYRASGDHQFDVPIRRILTANRPTVFGNTEVRTLDNLHMKVYILYFGSALSHVAVGLLNLVAPTLLDTMVLVNYEQARFYQRLFTNLWKQAK